MVILNRILCLLLQNRLCDDLREIPVFQFVYPGGKVVGGVCREHRAFGLKDDSALVVVIIDIMNGDAAFLFAGCNNGFVHMVSVHAFTAIGREKGRMDVDEIGRAHV